MLYHVIHQYQVADRLLLRRPAIVLLVAVSVDSRLRKSREMRGEREEGAKEEHGLRSIIRRISHPPVQSNS